MPDSTSTLEPKYLLKPTTSIIPILREHLKQHQYAEFNWPKDNRMPLQVDVQTINVLLKVYDAADRARNPDKMRSGMIKKMLKDRENFLHVCDIGWKAVTPASA